MILKRTASQKPFTSNPLRIELVKRIIKAFITKLKSPNVKTISGMDINTKIGFMKAFKRLIITAAKRASLIEFI